MNHLLRIPAIVVIASLVAVGCSGGTTVASSAGSSSSTSATVPLPPSSTTVPQAAGSAVPVVTSTTISRTTAYDLCIDDNLRISGIERLQVSSLRDLDSYTLSFGLLSNSCLSHVEDYQSGARTLYVDGEWVVGLP